MRGLAAIVAVCVLGAGGVAGAQVVASDEPRDAPAKRVPPPATDAAVTYGWAGQLEGPQGYVVRLESTTFGVWAPEGTHGPVFGIQPGIEYWRSGDDHWGVSLPIAYLLGFRMQPLRGTIGLGFDVLSVDQVANDTGLGIMTPFATARLGFDVLGVHAGVDARVGHRWQIGADEHSRWQLGVFVGRTWEQPAKLSSRARIARP